MFEYKSLSINFRCWEDPECIGYQHKTATRGICTLIYENSTSTEGQVFKSHINVTVCTKGSVVLLPVVYKCIRSIDISFTITHFIGIILTLF